MKLNKKAFELALAKKQMSKAELSAKSGVSLSTITKLSSEKHEGKPKTAGKIAQALGVDVADIMKED